MYVDMIICYDYAHQSHASVDLKTLGLSRVCDLYSVLKYVYFFSVEVSSS